VLFLAIMWIAVLAPPYLRSRTERLPSESRQQGFSALTRRRSSSSGYMPVASPAGRPLAERSATPVQSSAMRPIAPTGLHVPRGSTGFEIRGSAPEPAPSVPTAETPPRVRTEPLSLSADDLREQSDAELLARYDEDLAPRNANGNGNGTAEAEAPLAEVTHLAMHRNGHAHRNGNGQRNGHRPAERPEGAGEKPQVPSAVMARRQARARRRAILKGLLAASGVTLVLALGLGGSFFFLHLLCDVALGAYVYMLLHVQKTQAEREIKVAFLPHGGQGAAPSALLEQSGGFQPGGLRPLQSEVR